MWDHADESVWTTRAPGNRVLRAWRVKRALLQVQNGVRGGDVLMTGGSALLACV